ncbi:MAG: GIY-YIG nuclease family protein [Cellulosilyticaceae bacterium]
MGHNIPMNKHAIRQTQLYEQSKQLLKKTGVYLMYDDAGSVLYVGKSIHIKRRVGSYFLPSVPHSKKISKMIRLVAYFHVFYTDTELDALILECRLIKQYKPRYNTVLTKTHHYFYIDFYEQPTYAMKLGKSKIQKSTIRFGPFTNHRLAMHGIGYIKNAYPYLSCNFEQKMTINNCYAYQLKKCDGYCIQQTKTIFEVADEILIHNDNLIRTIETKMYALSEKLEFEKAHTMLQAMQGIKYLGFISKQIFKTYSQDIVIAGIPIADSLEIKLYVIHQGRILYTTKTYNAFLNQTITALKQTLFIFPQRQRTEITIELVDEILILQNYFSKMILLEKV